MPCVSVCGKWEVQVGVGVNVWMADILIALVRCVRSGGLQLYFQSAICISTNSPTRSPPGVSSQPVTRHTRRPAGHTRRTRVSALRTVAAVGQGLALPAIKSQLSLQVCTSHSGKSVPFDSNILQHHTFRV